MSAVIPDVASPRWLQEHLRVIYRECGMRACADRARLDPDFEDDQVVWSNLADYLLESQTRVERIIGGHE